ncbi:heavy metal resistance protein, partial [Salmonella enterica]|nr:heavy metal resistance protein [Salmonella enterica]EAS4418110.1 heavy metal resistance protein [Salmonella enterica]EAT8688880.1 heavy metal resistance protein [Salmonella enterica]EBG3593622.1 heavy metal resistance protein [Salmonella enterica]ECK3961376.1 heavy metal resistance protein [Salmonella enterica]
IKKAPSSRGGNTAPCYFFISP